MQPQATLPPRKLSRPGPLSTSSPWVRDGATSFEGGIVPRLLPPPHPNPNPLPQPVKKVPSQPKVAATRKKAGPKKPERKPTAAAQPAPGKSKKKVAASVNRGH